MIFRLLLRFCRTKEVKYKSSYAGYTDVHTLDLTSGKLLRLLKKSAGGGDEKGENDGEAVGGEHD